MTLQRWTFLLLCFVLLLLEATFGSPPPVRALLVGGGPDPDHNQVAIESNVRYVYHLLPRIAQTRILFTDGNLHSVNVLYDDAQGNDHYRAPHLPFINGPSRLGAFDKEFLLLTAHATGPLLLYFTGHGGPGGNNYDNNEYDLWGDDMLTVHHLAAKIDSLPSHMPVVLIMVECYSGGFGNVLFQGGDPQGALVNQDVCGFFASVPSREAAGCTAEVNQADYHDFTSYFFAALSGHDRSGRSVTGADYNHDGRVGMDEAFAYALIHDISIDTPTCTSDVFLRRFVPISDDTVFATSYADTLRWATPAQQAVLEALSRILGYTDHHRLETAYQAILGMTGDGGDEEDAHNAQVIRFARVAKSVILAHSLQTTGTPALQARYAALIAAEAGNPLLAH